MARDGRRQDDAHAGNGARLIGRLIRSWRHRVVVAGHSMEPVLREGDWILADPRTTPSVGHLVVAGDPRAVGRLLVKRVKSVDPDGSLVIGGDHPGHAEEEVRVPSSAVIGRPWLRYWPARRIGRIKSRG